MTFYTVLAAFFFLFDLQESREDFWFASFTSISDLQMSGSKEALDIHMEPLGMGRAISLHWETNSGSLSQRILNGYGTSCLTHDATHIQAFFSSSNALNIKKARHQYLISPHWKRPGKVSFSGNIVMKSLIYKWWFSVLHFCFAFFWAGENIHSINLRYLT